MPKPWTKHARVGFDVYRDALNTPAFLAVLPPIAGLTGLDIACGEAPTPGIWPGAGARMEVIDIAPISSGMQWPRRRGRLSASSTGSVMDLPHAPSSFDFVALMDMPDQGRVLREIGRVLKPEGFLQFSILHPCFVPAYRKTLREADGQVRAIEIGRYFEAIDDEVERW